MVDQCPCLLVQLHRRQRYPKRHQSPFSQASVGEGSDEGTAGRILFTAGTFDRGGSTQAFNGRDKFDFILMMMDEMREACEVGPRPFDFNGLAWIHANDVYRYKPSQPDPPPNSRARSQLPARERKTRWSPGSSVY